MSITAMEMDMMMPTLRPFDSFFDESTKRFHSEVDRMWEQMQADVFSHRSPLTKLREEMKQSAKVKDEPSKRPNIERLWDEMQADVFDRRLSRKLLDEKKEEQQIEQKQSESSVSQDGSFKVCVSVSAYKPEELTVKVIEENLLIEAHHKEKDEKTGRFKQQHFQQRFHIPKSCDMDRLTSSLSAEGVLTVYAPAKAIEAPAERPIHIQPMTRIA